MPTTTKCYSTPRAKAPLAASTIERRDCGPHDVLIAIQWSGVCHSDVHQVRSEWGEASFPMVPGHEILGRVSQVGSAAKKFKVGDTVGVGCMVDSCRTCPACHDHNEQFCDEGASMTYNGTERDKKTATYGGYSTHIVVHEDFALRIPKGMDPASTAPLLCAGITTYSPLRRYNVGPGKHVGVIGLGGLGHMAVKLAKAMGAHTTVLTHSAHKKEDALKMGADDVVITSSEEGLKSCARRFDLMINTVSAKHDLPSYMNCLRYNSAMVMLGLPDSPLNVGPQHVVGRGLSFGGSLIGGIKQTQEMLDFCAQHNITCDVEKIPMSDINKAYDRMVKNDVKYRFVIDMASLT